MKIGPIRADSPTKRRSQQHAKLNPAPAAGPLTAAMMGTSHSANAVAMLTEPMGPPSRSMRSCREVVGASPSLFCLRPIALTSAPAQNARPAPVSTTARTASSWEARWSASSNCARMASLNEFILSGRFMAISMTPASSTVTSRSVAASAMACSLRFAPAGLILPRRRMRHHVGLSALGSPRPRAAAPARDDAAVRRRDTALEQPGIANYIHHGGTIVSEGGLERGRQVARGVHVHAKGPANARELCEIRIV